MQIVKYTTEAEAQLIIAEKTGQGLILTDVSNITEGNFLGFKEPIEIPPVVPQSTVEDRLTNIEDTQDLILLKLEGVIV